MRNSMIRSIRSLMLLFAALVVPVLAMPTASLAQFSVSVSFAPPELPVYEQPICPGDGYIWTPGYWAWDGDDYYWVPGTWVLAPQPGYLWTPAYWGWYGGNYVFYNGYWGPQVGFYGGINYGYGYGGHGYDGGRWDNGHFFYNRSVNNVNVTVVHNVYETKVVDENSNVPRVSYNGGNGGVNARPTSQEQAAARERHVGPVAAQNEQVQAARSNSQLKASENHGNPPIAATTKPGAFDNRDVVAAKGGGSYNPPARAESAPKPNPIHPNELPPVEKPPAPNTGNAKLDQKYQQQQQKLSAQQDQARQKLQQQQDREHERVPQQTANDVRTQQVEQKHQQQTQQMVQKQAQQVQQMQQRQQPAHQAPPQASAQPKPQPEQHNQEQHH